AFRHQASAYLNTLAGDSFIRKLPPVDALEIDLSAHREAIYACLANDHDPEVRRLLDSISLAPSLRKLLDDDHDLGALPALLREHSATELRELADKVERAVQRVGLPRGAVIGSRNRFNTQLLIESDPRRYWKRYGVVAARFLEPQQIAEIER